MAMAVFIYIFPLSVWFAPPSYSLISAQHHHHLAPPFPDQSTLSNPLHVFQTTTTRASRPNHPPTLRKQIEKRKLKILRKVEPTEKRVLGALRQMNDGMETDQQRRNLKDARQRQQEQQEQQRHENEEQPQEKRQNAAPKPIFVYGTLCARPLLAWVLTGDATHIDEITPLICPAEAQNIARYALRGKDYPAAIRKEGATTKGYLLQPATRSQRRKMDDFEGEVYRVENAVVKRLDGLGNVVEGESVETDVYIWDGGEEEFDGEWDFGEFERERLEDWLDLFEGMEMVGDDDDDGR